MAKSAKPSFWIVRVASAHRRLGMSVVLGLVVSAALPGSFSGITRALLGWDAGVLFDETDRVLLCSDLFHQTIGKRLNPLVQFSV